MYSVIREAEENELRAAREAREQELVDYAMDISSRDIFLGAPMHAATLGKEVNPSPSAHGKAHHRRRTKSGPERTLAPRRPQARAARRDHTADCWRGRTNNHSGPGSKLRPHGASADEPGGHGSRQGCGGQPTAMPFPCT